MGLTYWVVLKSGDLRMQASRPKSREYVAESVVRDKRDMDKTSHLFIKYTKCGTSQSAHFYDAYHGYGRGPGKHKEILKILA